MSATEGRTPLNVELSDRECMALARHGDRASYGQLVLLYQDRLYNALLRFIGDAEEAAELTQETFARGLNRIADCPVASQPYAWLFGIAMNLALGLLRQSRRQRAAAGEGLEAAMARLDPEYRAVLVMRDIESFDYQQMSDVLALPPAIVKSRLFRARVALRDELKE